MWGSNPRVQVGVSSAAQKSAGKSQLIAGVQMRHRPEPRLAGQKKRALRNGAKGTAQCGARTHDHQIKSLVLYRLCARIQLPFLCAEERGQYHSLPP
jgi:hypothetical protein